MSNKLSYTIYHTFVLKRSYLVYCFTQNSNLCLVRGSLSDCILAIMTDPQTGQEKPPTPEKKVAVEADADEDIPHPTFEVYRHTLMRGANLGAFLSLVVGPPVLFMRGVRQPSEILPRLAGVCVKGVVS